MQEFKKPWVYLKSQMLFVHQSSFKNNGGSISFDHSAHDLSGVSLLPHLEIYMSLAEI